MIRCLIPLAAVLLCAGCAGDSAVPDPAVSEAEHSSQAESTDGTSSPEAKPESTAPKAESSESRPEPELEPEVLPHISIQTKNTAPDALDFVTKPVTAHVSEAIASWTPGYVIPITPYYEDCTVTVSGAESCFTADAAVKVRGNWTTVYDKKPLRLKFESKQNLLGLNGGAEMKNWVLLADYKDASLLRNRTALEMSRAVLGADGLYAADAALVEVDINSRYWGVYLLTEQQQVNPNRIDISEPEKGYTGTDIGYFLEFDGYFSNEDPLHAFHVDYADNAPLTPYDGRGGSGRTIRCLPQGRFSDVRDIGFTIKSEVYSEAQRDFIANYVNGVYRVLYAAAYENKALVFDDTCSQLSESAALTPREAVERVVNTESLADAYLIAELTCDADIYWSSFFMDCDFGAEGDRRLTFEAPWDFDSGLGNKDRCADGTGFYAANIVPDVNGYLYETVNPWLAVLMYQDWFQQIIREKWTAAYDSGALQRICAEISDDTSRYRAAFTRDNECWGVSTEDPQFEYELCARAKRCGSQKEAAAYLREWLEKRIGFVNSQWHQ